MSCILNSILTINYVVFGSVRIHIRRYFAEISSKTSADNVVTSLLPPSPALRNCISTWLSSMRVVIFGGTGRSGAAVAESLTAHGAEVVLHLRPTSIVPESLFGRVEERRNTTVKESLQGADAAVICVGNSALIKRETLRADVTKSVIDAADDNLRIVVVSALGARGSGFQLPFWIRHFALLLLTQPLKDHDNQENMIEQRIPQPRRLVVRPVQLNDGPATGRYHVCVECVTPSATVSRADVADFIADQLFDGVESGQNWWGSFVAISSK